jgi:DNA-binding transcriptional MerR regulator
VVPSTPTAAATEQKAIHHMSTEVTDDRAVRRSRKATPPTPDNPAGDEHPGVSRLYTVAMMADVLRVPRSAVRRWRRRGLIEPARRSGSIEWFGFPQLVVGRQLVRLLQSGLSLRDIDAQLPTLAPGGAAEAARIADRIVADGRRLSIRRDGGLMGAGGQLQLGFYTDALSEPVPQDRPTDGNGPGRPADDAEPATVIGIGRGRTDGDSDLASVAELLDLAADLESAGSLFEAAEALRAVLQAQGPTSQVAFMLAELLYRAGDLTAARERYYAAIELDADHLEARASLGCVLAELGEHDLAIAALDGVLRQQPDYADAHWHMAGVLRDAGREDESHRHLREFLTLAPESPWASLAAARLDAVRLPAVRLPAVHPDQ